MSGEVIGKSAIQEMEIWTIRDARTMGCLSMSVLGVEWNETKFPQQVVGYALSRWSDDIIYAPCLQKFMNESKMQERTLNYII